MADDPEEFAAAESRASPLSTLGRLASVESQGDGFVNARPQANEIENLRSRHGLPAKIKSLTAPTSDYP
jgi:hypothetical protein